MPILEMWLLITVGGRIGAVPTIALVLLTAVVGFHLLRRQGFETLWRGNRRLEEGQLPAQEIVEGIVLAVSGALLLTPGFVTDAIGFAGLMPFIRQRLVGTVLSRVAVTSTYQQGAFYSEAPRRTSGDVIEGEFTDKND